MPMIVLLVSILLTALGLSAWIWLKITQQAMIVQEFSAVPLSDTASPDQPAVFEEHPLAYEDRLRELREDIALIQARSEDEMRKAVGLSMMLRGENDVLKAKVKELEAAILKAGEGTARFDHLIVENAAFRGQMEASSAEVLRLRQEISRLEQENARYKQEADAAAGSSVVLQRAREEYQRQLEGAFAQVEEYRLENQDLRRQVLMGKSEDTLRVIDELAARVRELEATNVVQAEKNEYLQYELTKSRAQVVGLERLCENAAI